MKKFALLNVLIFICISSIAQIYGKNGIVVSDNKLSSQVGIDILKKGGNAIDAAVATAFSLAVTHPEAGNIGGGGFIVYMDSQGRATTIDFREKAPLAATATMYLDASGKLVEGSNHDGIKAIGVPGTVAGLYLAHKKYGRFPWKDLVQPAIDQAQKGIPLSLNHFGHASYIKDNISEPFLKNYFLNKAGNVINNGELWTQPALAKTLALIRDNGHDGFYKGYVAEEIEKYMKEKGGLITKKDLEKYSAIERAPVKGSFKGYDIFSMPPPSSGGVTLLNMLNMMEEGGIDSIAFNTAEYYHLTAEVMRRAYADRAQHLGDPDFNPDMPLSQIISKNNAKKKMKSFDPARASVSDSSKFGLTYEGGNTTHFSVIDKDGNAVSLTYTLENIYGSGMGSTKLGFIFNNEMGDFNPVPGLTNSHGLIGTKPNTVAPEKRMLSSMTPTIISKNGKVFMVIGSPGGRTIINTVFQTIIGVIRYDMSIGKAIEAPKIHHQWLPDQILVEDDKISPDTRNILEKLGHKLVPVNELGALMGILVDAGSGLYFGASDSSSANGAAVSY